MMKLIELREKMQVLYAKYSGYIDKAAKFVLALLTFFMINQKIGTMEKLTSPVVLLGLAVLCAFFSPTFTVVIAMGLIVAHMLSVSLGCAGVMVTFFLAMFLLYCRFTPERAIIILLVPVAFMLKVPYLIPILCGLMLEPITSIPIIFGTVIHYTLVSFGRILEEIAKSDDMMAEFSLFFKEVVQNKEVWVLAVALSVGVAVVYLIRRLDREHMKEAAIVAGAVVHIVVAIVAGNVFGASISIMELIVGNIAAVAIAYLINILFFAVDYKKVETVQYEDDDYIYYVKAIPKVSVVLPKEEITEEVENSEDTDEENGEENIEENIEKNIEDNNEEKEAVEEVIEKEE